MASDADIERTMLRDSVRRYLTTHYEPECPTQTPARQ